MERENKKFRVCADCTRAMEESGYKFVKRAARPENGERCPACRAKLESLVYILSKE